MPSPAHAAEDDELEEASEEGDSDDEGEGEDDDRDSDADRRAPKEPPSTSGRPAATSGAAAAQQQQQHQQQQQQRAAKAAPVLEGPLDLPFTIPIPANYQVGAAARPPAGRKGPGHDGHMHPVSHGDGNWS